MAAEKQYPEFRHPNTVAHSQSLTNEEAAKHPPISRERGGVVTQQGHDGSEARCSEGEADELPGLRVSETEADQKGCTQPGTVPFNFGGYLFKATCKHPATGLLRK